MVSPVFSERLPSSLSLPSGLPRKPPGFRCQYHLTAVQPCLQEGDLVNPVGPVFALLISHAFGKDPVHRTFHRGKLPWRLATPVWFGHGFGLER